MRISSVLSDDIKALRSVWCIGDDFLYQIFGALQSLKSEASIRNKCPPYIYEYYNVSAYYQNPLSRAEPTISCLLTALIEALNQHIYLPKYVILLCDKDIIQSADIWDFGVGKELENQVNWLLQQISRCLLTRHEDLKSKNPGSVTADITRVILVNMLRRPITEDRKMSKIWSLR